jgi:NADPH-ferrihemoprotein reductase
MLESAQGISFGGSVSDSAVVIVTTSLAVVIGLLVVLVWRRSWDQSGDKEVKPVVVPKLSEWIEAQEKEEQRWRSKREER